MQWLANDWIYFDLLHKFFQKCFAISFFLFHLSIPILIKRDSQFNSFAYFDIFLLAENYWMHWTDCLRNCWLRIWIAKLLQAPLKILHLWIEYTTHFSTSFLLSKLPFMNSCWASLKFFEVQSILSYGKSDLQDTCNKLSLLICNLALSRPYWVDSFHDFFSHKISNLSSLMFMS